MISLSGRNGEGFVMFSAFLLFYLHRFGPTFFYCKIKAATSTSTTTIANCKTYRKGHFLLIIYDLELDRVSFIFCLDLDIPKICVRAKNELSRSKGVQVEAEETQTDRRDYRHYLPSHVVMIKTIPITAMPLIRQWD